MTSKSVNEIIADLGIEQTGKFPNYGWKFNNKIIPRPSVGTCYNVVKREFGIDSQELKQHQEDVNKNNA